MTIASERIVANLRKTVFAKIMNQDISFFDMRKTGELVNRLSSDTTMMGRTLVDNMAQGLRRIVEGIGGLGGRKHHLVSSFSTYFICSVVVLESQTHLDNVTRHPASLLWCVLVWPHGVQTIKGVCAVYISTHLSY